MSGAVPGPPIALPEPAPAPSRRTVILVALLAMAALVPGLLANRPPLFYDDAMFFLRYAEHLALGEGFRWNLGEPPIWGASAPLWPMLIAGLIRCGLSPETGALVLGWVLALSGAAALAIAALRCAGISGAAWCILFQATDWRLSGSALSGMESPLAMFLVSCGVLALSGRAAWWSVGTLAGLAMAEKIDLAPFGVLLLAGAWLGTGRPPWRAALLAGAIAGAWYFFAYLHFGSVIPQSFITKLHSKYGGMNRNWFVSVTFLEGGRVATTLAAALALPALWRRKELLVACGGLMLVMVAGYTLRPPAEDFGWYQAPIQPALCFLAGIGFGSAMEALMRRALMGPWVRVLVQLAALGAVGALCFHQDRMYVEVTDRVLSHTDGDRADAGRWIDRHTPQDARLLTGYGHISYYAHRYTIDEFCLNRRAQPQTTAELIAAFRPEVVAMCIFRTGIPPEKYTPPPGYRLVKLFDSTYRDRVDDYYVVVLLRNDLPLIGGDQS